jgi:hypothetical protein
MKTQLNEIQRMQQLAGLLVENEQNNKLLDFVTTNKEEISNKVGAKYIDTIEIDNLGDVSAIGVYDIDGDESEGGISFRFPKDVDGEFKGEEGSQPISIKINGIELMYVGYNI